MRSISSTSLTAALLFTGAAIFVPGTLGAQGVGAEHSDPVYLRILAFNDLHGYLDTPLFAYGVPVGGIDHLATTLRYFESQAEHTIIVSAGDLIGGSPFLSGWFHDEPTIEAANLLGLDLSAVGNHEFDEGVAELLRMQNGGCHPVDGCLDGDGFDGADFQFLAANVVDEETGETLFPSFVIKNFKGVRVAFIGLTTADTPWLVSPPNVAGWTFRDEVDTLNAVVARLRQIQIEAIVVLIHEGGYPIAPYTCGGPIVDIVERTDPAVDLFITGHTHWDYVCFVGGRPVISAWAEGRLFSLIDVELNRVTKEMSFLGGGLGFNARNVPPAADVRALLDRYHQIADPIGNAVIGSITTDISRARNAAGESALGDVITDAQLAATAAPAAGGARMAFTNSGGLRANLAYLSSGGEAPGEVTFAEAWAVQPFNNHLVTMTLTGAQIDALLELQFGDSSRDVLQVSEGFEYAWSASAPVGSKVDPATIKIDGVTIDPGAGYRVTVASFLAVGGGGFGEVLLAGGDRLHGMLDLEAVVDYFAAHSPLPPGPQDRITVLP